MTIRDRRRLVAAIFPASGGGGQSIHIPRGQDTAFDIECIDKDGPLDLTGGVLRMDVRQGSAQGPVVISRSATIQTPATDGLAEMLILSADTMPLTPALRYVYDLWFVDSDGVQTRVIRQYPFVIEERVTDVDADASIPVPSSPIIPGPPGPTLTLRDRRKLIAAVFPATDGGGQSIRIPRGQDTAVDVEAYDEDGPLDLTGGALVINVRQGSAAGPIVIARQATILLPGTDGRATFDFVAADTILLNPALRYVFDCWFVDADGTRTRVVPQYPFYIEERVTDLSANVTVPVQSPPLAQGPPGHPNQGQNGDETPFDLPDVLQVDGTFLRLALDGDRVKIIPLSRQYVSATLDGSGDDVAVTWSAAVAVERQSIRLTIYSDDGEPMAFADVVDSSRTTTGCTVRVSGPISGTLKVLVEEEPE